jgi:uncharacterized SAM-binding protein YcdF (DUF218 family)
MSFHLFRERHRAQPLRVLCMAAGLGLLADSLFVMSHRVFHFGVAVPLVLGAALLVLGWQLNRLKGRIAADSRCGALWRWAWIVFFAWLATVLVFFTAIAGRDSPPASASDTPAAIIVLGSGTRDGKASPVLAARLDTAFDRARANPSALVVVSGGVDFNETRSEAQVMGDYLRAKGLAPSRITQEEKSTSTEENLRFSRLVMQDAGVSVERARVELVTSDFHIMRSRWIAERVGYKDVGAVGAPTPLYVRYNAWLREYFAVISGFLLREY